MSIFSFQLSTFSPVRSIFLRELNGHDELLVYDNSTPCVLQLLNNIIVQPFSINGQQNIKAEKIAVADRDYLLSGIYKYTYGPSIESSMDCNACGERYDLNFLLEDLIMHTGNRKNDVQIDSEGFFHGDDGVRFRLPNGEDEMAAWGLPTDEAALMMFDRCLAQQVTKENKRIMEVMEELGPVLTTDIGIKCPECDSNQNVQFDIQSYLLTRLKNEQKKLAVEIHSIAITYGWSHKEILDLSKTMRQTYANLINQN